MSEWGIPFDHIEENWTDHQFLVMAKRLEERLTRKSGESGVSGFAGENSGRVSYTSWLRKQGVIH